MEATQEKAIGTILAPLGDRVIVSRVKERHNRGSIIIPDSAKEKPQIGIVEAVGDKCSSIVSPRSVVLFGKYAGTEIELEGGEFLLMREEEILPSSLTWKQQRPWLAGR